MKQKELEEVLDKFDRYKDFIGGRDADIEQLALCLAYYVKEEFEINQVPDHIIMSLDILRKKMVMAKNCYLETIKTIQDEFKKIFEEEQRMNSLGFSVRCEMPPVPNEENVLNLTPPLFATPFPLTIHVDWRWVIEEIIKRKGSIDFGTLTVLEQLQAEDNGIGK